MNRLQLADLYHLAELVREYDTSILATADLLLETMDNFNIYNKSWNGSPVEFPGFVDYANAKGVTIEFPDSAKSFYNGEWIEFAQGADWSFATNSSTKDNTRASEFYWGPMISEMVRLHNPDGPDQSKPPDLVGPLNSLENIYLPLIIK